MKVIIALFVCLAIVSAKICPECEKTVKSATGEQCVYDPPCCPQGKLNMNTDLEFSKGLIMVLS